MAPLVVTLTKVLDHAQPVLGAPAPADVVTNPVPTSTSDPTGAQPVVLAFGKARPGVQPAMPAPRPRST